MFLSQLIIAKWNIYCCALQDLTLFTLSYLKVNIIINRNKLKEIFKEILDAEGENKLPLRY